MKTIKLLCLCVGLFFVTETRGQEYMNLCGGSGQLVDAGGILYCDCGGTNMTGYRCDMFTEPCQNHTCQNMGYCSTDGGGTSCICPMGFGGKRCEYEDESNSCPEIDWDDEMLLPLCTVKTTASRFAQCINNQLPYSGPNVTEATCRQKISLTLFCLYDMLVDCSRSLCPSVYLLPGAPQMFTEKIFNPLLNPNPAENFAFDLMCSETFDPRRFNISFFGPPVCRENVLDMFFYRLMMAETDGIETMQGEMLCSALSNLKHDIHGIFSDSCYWGNITALLPDSWGSDEWRFVRGMNIAQSFFLEWYVPGCEPPEPCHYLNCMNGGNCTRNADGVEYCQCTGDFGGLLCDYRKGMCRNDTCVYGRCHEFYDVVSCECYPGFDGPRCEYRNDSAQCAMPDSGDMPFYSQCTLKTALAKFSECINYHLPFLNPVNPDQVKCRANLTSAAVCLYKVQEECGGVMCYNSMWHTPGFLELYTKISSEVLNPYSNFSMSVTGVVCSLPGPSGMYEHPNNIFNIGGPICQDDLLDNLVRLLADASNRHSTVLQQICSTLDVLRMGIHDEVARSCDWSRIYQVLPQSAQNHSYVYEQMLTIAQSYFTEWVIPPCRNSTAGLCGVDTCKNGGYCSSNLGSVFCACAQGWGGPRCEELDGTNTCPVTMDGDSLFLPLCTMKTTFNKLLSCGGNLHNMLFGQSSQHMCDNAIRTAFHCVAEVIGNCSRSLCPSIWLLPGVPEIGNQIIAALFDENVLFYAGQYACSPPPAGGYLQFLGNMTLNVGAPVCPNSFLNELIAIARDAERELLAGPTMQQACRTFQSVQARVYNVLSRCDFNVLRYLLPREFQEHSDDIINGLNTARDYLRTFELPFCRDIGGGGGSGSCPQISTYSSQCQLADAWMCQYFNYKKSQSEWGTEFMAWWASCSGFSQRNWDDWASGMGLMRGDNWPNMGTSYGEEGFARMLKANFPCPDVSYMDCQMGEHFTNILGCTYCYRQGSSFGNIRNLFMTWMTEQRQSQIVMKIYNALRMECTGTSASCEGGMFSTTPFPTGPSSTFSSPWPTGPSSTFSSPWPTSSSSWPGTESTTFSTSTTRHPVPSAEPTMKPREDTTAMPVASSEPTMKSAIP